MIQEQEDIRREHSNCIPTCDTCGDQGDGARQGEPCGRDLSEELGQEDGTTVCTGTYMISPYPTLSLSI